MERFVGQLAVVTGAGGGIGSAITKELLKRNVNVVGLDANVQQLQSLQEEILGNKPVYKGAFYSRVCDITNDVNVRETFQWIHKNFKTFAILINVAGVCRKMDNDVQTVDADVIDLIFAVNVKGLLLCAREALNSMINNSISGHMINFCSLAGYDKFPDQVFPIYAASKHAVRVMSNSLRCEVNRKRVNIKVTNLSPGLVNTEMLSSSDVKLTDVREEFLDPKDIADGCISVLSTPPHVLISDILIEPLYQIEVPKITHSDK